MPLLVHLQSLAYVFFIIASSSDSFIEFQSLRMRPSVGRI
jgi:hypothetical protein